MVDRGFLTSGCPVVTLRRVLSHPDGVSGLLVVTTPLRVREREEQSYSGLRVSPVSTTVQGLSRLSPSCSSDVFLGLETGPPSVFSVSVGVGVGS